MTATSLQPCLLRSGFGVPYSGIGALQIIQVTGTRRQHWRGNRQRIRDAQLILSQANSGFFFTAFLAILIDAIIFNVLEREKQRRYGEFPLFGL